MPRLRPDEERARDPFADVPVEIRQDIAQARNIIERLHAIGLEQTGEGRKLRAVLHRLNVRGYGTVRLARWTGLSESRIGQLLGKRPTHGPNKKKAS
jgi:hypothetical protein